MKNYFLSLTLFFAFSLNAQEVPQAVSIIPEPVSITRTPGVFHLPSTVQVEIPSGTELGYLSDLLRQKLSIPTGLRVNVSNQAPSATIRFQLTSKKDEQLGDEGYILTVTPNNILVAANAPAGLFYGAQSLFQLMPPAIESKTAVSQVKWDIPCIVIRDYPRFAWRGLMLDVARHFFTKQEVMQFIDNMVRYKYNVLHFHLTDDEGWRIEIRGLPRLTEVGAWNVKKTGYFGTFSKPLPDEPRNYGGFYTQDDIRELVQYAKARFVNIMPEVDVPGHSLAAIVSYPDLACIKGAEKFGVSSGEPIKDWSHGAPPIALVDDNLCPANERVYTFLDTVITQLAQLFPFQYIHMGGDECARNFWQKSSAIKALMKRENLKTMEQVQGYFSKRVEQIVVSKGKKFIGWDEIMEGGLPPSAAVMSWQGVEHGFEAARMGHEVVMSPTTFTYLDYMQADPVIEPHVYASLRLNKTYEFNPAPAGVDAKFIKGGQGNIWTEQIYNVRTLEYMTWPRALAIAECVWSPDEKKNWTNFFQKVEKHFTRLDMAEVKYSRAAYDPLFDVALTPDKELQISLSTEVDGLDIYYSFDNSFPDRFYPKYTQPLVAPKDAVMLKVITYKGKEPVGRMIAMPVEELRNRAGKKK